MFSKEIVGSDAFQDMPASSQLLYFHLGMEADDDGFIGNPKKIARSIGMAEDDMKILVAKRFVLLFPSGVLVIKHHRINNNWDKYNCKRTVYMEEFNQLYIKENMAYTTDKMQGILLQSENSLKTVFRREEKRVEENRKEEKKEKIENSLAFLENLPEEFTQTLLEKYNTTPKGIKDLGETLANYCRSKGKKYSNYKALYLNAAKRDFTEKNDNDKERQRRIEESKMAGPSQFTQSLLSKMKM